MTRSCGCCAGCGSDPLRVRNRPGLTRLETRIGDHRSFFDAMIARLSSSDYARLARLRSRSLDDAGIALLDAWAVVADVLAFYQERIANEAYLRTATERRSLVEIARLVGYRPRPGVAASAYLAFTLENESPPTEIPKGTRVNSVPGPGETMVAFETSEPIKARLEWSAIRPRLVRPQQEDDLLAPGLGLYLKGTKTALKPNDPLLVRFGDGVPKLGFIHSLVEDHDNDRTLVRFDPPETAAVGSAPAVNMAVATGPSVHGISSESLLRSASVPPASAAALPRTIESSFSSSSDTLPRLLGRMQPALDRTLYQAMRNAPPAKHPPIRVFAMRVEARPFGHNAPLRLISVDDGYPVMEEWTIGPADAGSTTGLPVIQPATPASHGPRQLYLDNDYNIGRDSLIAIVRHGDAHPIILGTAEARTKEKLALSHLSLNAYGISGKSVLVEWAPGDPDPKRQTPPWLNDTDDFTAVRRARIFAASEELELAQAPIVDDVTGDRIELDGLYDGLEPGRWLIVEGERSDIVDVAGRIVPGVVAAELAMLAAVEQTAHSDAVVATPGDDELEEEDAPPGDDELEEEDAPPGNRLRTLVTLAGQAGSTSGLAYRYRRDTVRIHANVAAATHGETRAEVIGSGDAAASMQTFALKQPPLTHVTAATPSGTASTLELRVNDVLWHEVASLAALGPADRKYVTRDDDSGVTSLVFGNGVRGARLPTGRENVKAVYRSGIGRMGNVAAGQLSLLATRPLGVKGVVNPLRASGGADRESAASIRRNAPLALMALDRLVSTSDYGDFARSFGGVGKASTLRTRDGSVEVTIAGVDDVPIDETSELIRNLADALRRFGDRQVPVRVVPRERLVLIVKANVRIHSDHQWTTVEPKIRAALLDEFGFERIELGEWLPLGRALKAVQAVPGVIYADIDVFDFLSEDDIFEGFSRELSNQLGLKDLLEVGPGQIAYLTPDVPDTLILQELKT